MVSYLNEKYHSTFVVHNMWFNTLGSVYEGTDYPKKKPSLTFTVEQSVAEKSGYTDLYPAVFWNTQQAEPMKAYILNLFPNLNKHLFTVEPKFGETVGAHIPIFRSMSFDSGVMCLMTIQMEENWFALSPAEQKSERDKINKLRTYLQAYHFPVFVEFFYDTESEDNSKLKAIFLTESGEIVER